MPRPDLRASVPFQKLGLSLVCDREALKGFNQSMSCIVNSSPRASVRKMELKRIFGQCNSPVQAYKGPNAKKTSSHSIWSLQYNSAADRTHMTESTKGREYRGKTKVHGGVEIREGFGEEVTFGPSLKE